MGSIEMKNIYETTVDYINDRQPKESGENIFTAEDFDTSQWVK